MWRFGGPGGDLLFHALRRSTIGAEGFHGRVRDGIGCFAPRYGHQAGQAAGRIGSFRVIGRGPLGERGLGGGPTVLGLWVSRGPRGPGSELYLRDVSWGRGLPPLRMGPGFRWGIVRPTAVLRATGFLNGFCRWVRTLKPIERLVPVSCAGCPASTSGLST